MQSTQNAFVDYNVTADLNIRSLKVFVYNVSLLFLWKLLFFDTGLLYLFVSVKAN